MGIGGSVKTEHSEGKDKTEGKVTTDTREALMFEATGGNTILAAELVLNIISFVQSN